MRGGARTVGAGALLAALVWAAPARAQDESVPATELSREELAEALRLRDAALLQLEARIGRLEQALIAVVQAAEADGAAVGPRPAGPPEAPEPVRTAQAEPAPAAPDAEPGDEDAIDRALERALLQTGALVLPRGMMTVEPSFTYRREERNAPTFFVSGDAVLSGNDALAISTTERALTIQLGLPLRTQVEVELPHRVRSQETTTTVAFVPVDLREVSHDAFGDVRVALSRGLLRERGRLPNLVGTVVWNTDTGTEDQGVRTGTGFHELSGFLTATKRADPLVFVGSLGYTHTLDRGEVQPGDRYTLSLGSVLAASPETSLRLQLSQSYAEALAVRGRTLTGTDAIISSLTAGASVTAGPLLIDASVGVGLSEAAPDYTINLNFPIRARLFQ